MFNTIMASVLMLIDFNMLGPDNKATFGLFSLIYGAAVLLPGLGVSVRRLHDIGRSG